MNALKRFHYLFLKSEKSKKLDKFNEIMSMAEEIAVKRPEALDSFVKLVLQKYQRAGLLRYVFDSDYERGINLEMSSIWFNDVWHLGESDLRVRDVVKRIDNNIELDLASDLIFSFPWKKGRVVDCLTKITAKNWGQDDNHKVLWFEPFDIGWVIGGNHSIMAGIVNGDGKLKPYMSFDCSRLLDYFYTDGLGFYRKSDNQLLFRANSLEFAAIFEITRLKLMHLNKKAT